jgi:transcriptional regulator with XRE-family HTH domain
MNDAALETVARNVKAARLAAGLSLDALAGRAEVSKGALVALEGARGNPNLTTLVGIADALGRSVSSLMEEPEEEAPVVVDAREVTPLWTGPSGGTARLLLTNPRPSPVEVWRWILHPGERYESNPHPAGATETLTVIRGRMTFTAGDAAQRLRGGETAVFAADVPHSYEGSGRGPCELIMTVHIPPEHHNG